MPKKLKKSSPNWVDPDDAPSWTKAMLERAEVSVAGKVIRPAKGTLTKRGRPKIETPKVQVSVRLDPKVLAELKRHGDKWQVTLNDILIKWAKDKANNRPEPIKEKAQRPARRSLRQPARLAAS